MNDEVHDLTEAEILAITRGEALVPPAGAMSQFDGAYPQVLNAPAG